MKRRMLIRPFRAEDQFAAKALILVGLVEHWGWLDESLNPDLNDIATSFADGCFLVGYRGNDILAVGGYHKRADDTIEVVRMSVRGDLRGDGLGTELLNALLAHARAAGYARAILETTSTWKDVIQFYLRSDTWFERLLTNPTKT
jgi:putative acetyltransferase